MPTAPGFIIAASSQWSEEFKQKRTHQNSRSMVLQTHTRPRTLEVQNFSCKLRCRRGVCRVPIQKPSIKRRHQQHTHRADDTKVANLSLRQSGKQPLSAAANQYPSDRPWKLHAKKLCLLPLPLGNMWSQVHAVLHQRMQPKFPA